MYTLCFLVAPVKLKVYKKVVKFSFKQQKIFWVLVFTSIYLVLVDAMDKSKDFHFFRTDLTTAIWVTLRVVMPNRISNDETKTKWCAPHGFHAAEFLALLNFSQNPYR